jgi:hypothetical protein
MGTRQRTGDVGEGTTMNDWQRSDTIEGNGYFWENTAEGMAAFEDTSEGEGASRWYAWMGSVDDHDNAEHSPVRDSLVQAVVAIP